MKAIWQSKYVRVLSIVLLVQAALFYTASHGDSRPLPHPLNQFPQILPAWQGILDGVVDKETLDILKADDVLSRFYVRSPMPELSQMTKEKMEALVYQGSELFVAYFNTQQQGQSPHSPKNCLPGSGWQPTETGELDLAIPGLAEPIRINKYVIIKGESQSVVLYWYQSHGRVVANEFAAKFYLVADSMRYHRSDTALVRVVVKVTHGLDTAMKDATEFAQAVYPAILNYLPR